MPWPAELWFSWTVACLPLTPTPALHTLSHIQTFPHSPILWGLTRVWPQKPQASRGCGHARHWRRVCLRALKPFGQCVFLRAWSWRVASSHQTDAGTAHCFWLLDPHLFSEPSLPSRTTAGIQPESLRGGTSRSPGTESWARSRLPRECSPEGHMLAGQDHSVLSSSPPHTCSNQKKMTIQEQPRQWKKASGVLF